MNHLRLSLILRLRPKVLSVSSIQFNSVIQQNVDRKNFQKFRENSSEGNNLMKVNFGSEKLVIKKAQSIKDEQNKLIGKHAHTIGESPRTVIELLDRIEYYNRSGYSTMESMIEFLNDKKFDINLLSDRQISLIFKASGDLCYYCDSDFKDRYTDKFFNILQQREAKFGIMGMNSYFKTKLDNGNPIPILEFYELLSKYEIEPNTETFEIIAENFAKKGDSKNVYDLINTMKEVDLSPTIKMFTALIESLVMSNQIEKARSVILSFENKRILSSLKDLKLAFINGLASSGKFDLLHKEIQGFDKEFGISMERNNYSFLEPLVLFANASNNIEQVKKIRQLVPPIPKTEFSEGFDLSINKFYGKCCDLIEKKKIGVASILIDILPDSFKKRSENKIILNFNRKMFDENQNNDILEDVALLKEYNIVENPFISSLTRCDGINKKKFFEVFEKFRDTEEFKLLKSRFFVGKANIIYLMDQFDATQSENEKIEIVSKIFEAIDEIDHENINKCEKDQLNYLRSNFVRNLMNNNFNLLGKVIENLKTYHLERIMKILVSVCLRNKKYEDLQNILDIALKKKVYIDISQRVLPIIQSILQNKTSDKEAILSCCSLLSCAYHNKADINKKRTIISVLSDVISNIHISDSSVSSMIDRWAEEKMITLTKDQVNSISEILDSRGLVSRKPYLEVLAEKSTTLLRWLGTKDIRILEQELAFLEENKNEKKSNPSDFLRTIIIAKYVQQTPLNYIPIFEHLKKIYKSENERLKFKVKNVPTELMRSLVQANENKLADDLWSIEGVKLDTYALLLYAFNLFLRNEKDKMSEMFDYIKNNVRTIDAETTAMMSNYIPDVEDGKIHEFSELIYKKFNVSKKVTDRIYVKHYQNTFENLLKQNKLEEAFEVAKNIGSINSSPYGQIDLLSSSIKFSNTKLFSDVLNWVKELHNNYTAYIDATVALLENGKVEIAEKTLNNIPNIMISEQKLRYIVEREKKLNNVDALKFMLKFIGQKDWVSDEMINITLSSILDIYEKQNLSSEISKYKETLIKEKFPFTVKADLLFKKYS